MTQFGVDEMQVHQYLHKSIVSIVKASPQKHMILKRATRFLGTKVGILGHQSKLDARENARATLCPNKEIFKLKKTRAQNEN